MTLMMHYIWFKFVSCVLLPHATLISALNRMAQTHSTLQILMLKDKWRLHIQSYCGKTECLEHTGLTEKQTRISV